MATLFTLLIIHTVPSSGFFASPGVLPSASCGKTVPLACGRLDFWNKKTSPGSMLSLRMSNNDDEQKTVARVTQALDRTVPGLGKQMQQTLVSVVKDMVKRKVDEQELVGLVVQVCRDPTALLKDCKSSMVLIHSPCVEVITR